MSARVPVADDYGSPLPVAPLPPECSYALELSPWSRTEGCASADPDPAGAAVIGTLAAIGRQVAARVGCWMWDHDWQRWSVKQPSQLRWTPWFCLRCGAVEDESS